MIAGSDLNKSYTSKRERGFGLRLRRMISNLESTK
jgi:hypothetical protein